MDYFFPLIDPTKGETASIIKIVIIKTHHHLQVTAAPVGISTKFAVDILPLTASIFGEYINIIINFARSRIRTYCIYFVYCRVGF